MADDVILDKAQRLNQPLHTNAPANQIILTLGNRTHRKSELARILASQNKFFNVKTDLFTMRC